MTPLQIRGLIMFKTNMMPAAFGKTAGISVATMHRTITATTKSKRVRDIISNATGMVVKDLWPE